MKKGLSVLLIAAALFGFYGGAVNLNDVLASKTYWEKEGERSTADMNKLEDGLNQLKDNEQAYLDGVNQVADGEEALAAGEQTLANGYKQLAQGESDYAAAPGKLKDGKKKLSDITRLINGLNKAYRSYNNYSVGDDGKKGMAWVTGFEKKASKSDFSDAGLRQARTVITSTIKGKADQMALIGSMVGDSNIISNIDDKATYKQFDNNVKKLVKAFGAASEKLRSFAALANKYASNSDLTTAYTLLVSDKEAEASAADAANKIVKGVQAKAGLSEDQAKAILSDSAMASKYGLDDYAEQYQVLTSPYAKAAVRKTARNSVQDAMKSAQAALGNNLDMVKGLNADLYTSMATSMGTLLANNSATSDANYANALATLKTNLETLATTLNGLADELDANAKTLKSWDAGYNQLKVGQDQLADTSSGIPYAFKNMRTNETLRKALKTKVPGTYAKLAKYTGNRLANDDMDQFAKDMKDISSIIKKVMPVLRSVKANGQKDYAQGLRDYHAAPGKLASARSQLAAGEQTLADGRKTLADGKNKLAEYEDGEAQVRDGLATLMGTEANGGLQSILDRRNGDNDFLNGDAHLELEEGLEAVGVGRAYQSDSGELITTEITRRAVGAGLGLAAGALAVLAGLLSFLKKHRGAGVCAILAAIAGGAGIGVGTSAGMEFSRIAGSSVGSTPMVAAGILAAVALIHAIVHFSAKKDA